METTTKIFVSKKLERILPAAFIEKDSGLGNNPLGKWNATLFYISRKKCMLLTNSMTRYSFVMSGFGKSELKDITNVFVSTFAKQLERDGVLVDATIISKVVGTLSFSNTDNDKRTIGVQNHILIAIEDWKFDFGDYSNWDFYEIGKRLNGTPYDFVAQSGKREMLTPKVKMGSVISGLIECC